MEKKKKFYLSLKMRLLFLLFVIVIPLTFMVAGYQRMFENYSRSYNEIMANLKVANEYNIKFKSDMEYSMYRVMIGLIDVDKFENGDILEGKSKYATVVKNPLNMIASARHAFGKSIERVPGSDGDIKIKGILVRLCKEMKNLLARARRRVGFRDFSQNSGRLSGQTAMN